MTRCIAPRYSHRIESEKATYPVFSDSSNSRSNKTHWSDVSSTNLYSPVEIQTLKHI